MLVLKPIRHDTIWGGSRITQLTGVKGDSIGHLYSLYCRNDGSNEILNGCWRGHMLNDVFSEWKKDFGMEGYDFFPLTLALTEADLNLSIQVHPDDEMASEIEHKTRGKRESWYFLEPPSDGKIISGCLCKNNEELNELILQNRYMELIDTLPVSKGDYVFVEPGTIHSITAGSLVYEIEEGADYTYRFYDYDRVDDSGNKRELHTEKALKALHMNQKSFVQHYEDDEEIVEKTYTTRRLVKKYGYENLSETIECFTFIRGRAEVDGIMLTPGMTVLLWPKEKLMNIEIDLAFVAKMRRDIE